MLASYYQPHTEEKMNKTVDWYGLNYTEIVQNGMLEQVKSHVITELNEEKQIEYVKYLRSWCNFPNDFMGL